MNIATIAKPKADDAAIGLSDTHIACFLKDLDVAGYAKRTCRKKHSVAKAFARWMQGGQIALQELNESHVTAFVIEKPKPRAKFESAVLSLLLKYLRREAKVPSSPMLPAALPFEDLSRAYVNYLRKDCGLAENSILVYAPFVRDFLEHVAKTGSASVKAIDAHAIRNFLLDRTRDRSGQYARLLAAALRSFLRFVFVRGYLAADISSAVPTVRRFRQAAMPAFLSPEEVGDVLAAVDQSTPPGRRNYAILLLLARLALRAGEVVALELEDIGWRTGELAVRGKGRRVEYLPLLSDVGEALARYLREDRGVSASRRLFLRTLAPRVGLKGPAAVGHIVRRALAQAGVQRSGRGAAHLFRHSLGTQMVRRGASLSEIGQVLRHDSQSTTAIYAHVSFEALRTVARPWPVLGGAQ